MKAVRVVPLVMVIASFTMAGAMRWFETNAVAWLHIVLLAAAFAILCGPGGTWLRRAIRGFSIGLATSIILVAIALALGWIADRQHFFDDGGPVGALLVIEAYVGLPAAFVGAILSGFAGPIIRVATKLRAPQSA